MSQINQVEVCRLRETNDIEASLTLTVKIIEQKMIKFQHSSIKLQKEVEKLKNENILLDKQISSTGCSNLLLETEISALKIKTEEAAYKLEQINWKIFKTEILKDFEITRNECIEKRKCTDQQLSGDTSNSQNDITNDFNSHFYHIQNINNVCYTKDIEILRKEISQLRDEIVQKKNAIQMIDSKLYFDIQMLEKRNAALLLRYQRQFQEAESRLRQSQYELNSLEKLLLEKDNLLLKKGAFPS